MKSGIRINIKAIEEIELASDKSLFDPRDLKRNLNMFLNMSKELTDEIKSKKNGIDNYIKEYKEGKRIEVTKISQEIFPLPEKEIDFFISYSYEDRRDANKLADFLKELGFNVFVDNQEWGSVYELLEEIDKKISNNKENKSYDYKLKNEITSNVFSMLSIALSKVIRKSKYFIIVDSENLIKEENGELYTFSPWLEYEIEIFNMIVPYDNLYSNHQTKDTIMLESINWIREYNLNDEYFSFLSGEELNSLSEIKKVANKHRIEERIINYLKDNHEKLKKKESVTTNS